MKSQPPAVPAPSVPDHQLLRPIGRGSYGEVWLARNIMGAWRAVKVVRRDTFDSERPFEREFGGIQRYEPISRSVEGVVPVLHVGRNPEGFHYVMELADDASGSTCGNTTLDLETYVPRTLRSDLNRLGRLPVADCLEVGLALAAGLAHLHRHGLVHRDLKPSNIIFVNGRARLADLGLVGSIDEARSFVGTTGYIPPEGPGLPGADLFGLGRVLYEAVTGFPPNDFPNPPPDWLTGEIPHDALELHEVILRACEPDPTSRYRSAAELQADLTLLQSGHSVRRVRRLERRLKSLRRAGMAGVLAVLVISALGLFAGYRARTERETALRAEVLRGRAEIAEKHARAELANARIAQAGLIRRSGLVGQRNRTLALIREADGTPDRLAEMRTEAIAARALPDLREKRVLSLTGPPGQWCAMDPGLTRYTRAHADGSVWIHSWEDDRELVMLEGAQAGGLMVWPFSASGGRLGGRRGEHAFVWDTINGRLVFDRDVPGMQLLDLTPDGSSLALRFADGRVQLVSLPDGSAGARITPGFADGDYWFSPDGNQVAFFSPSRCEVHLFDSKGGSHRALQLPPPACPRGLMWTPDGKGLLLAADDFRGYFVRLDQPELRAVRMEGHQAEIVGGACHPAGQYALSTSWDETTRIWSLATGRQLLRIMGRGTEFSWVADGRLGWLHPGEPGHFRLMEYELSLPSGARVLAEPVPPRSIASNKGAWDVAFVAAGRVFAVASYDGVRLWPIGGGEPRLIPLGWTRWLEADSAGTTLWASTDREILRIDLRWDEASGQVSVGEPIAVGAVGRELPVAPVGQGPTFLSARGRELLRVGPDAIESIGELPDLTTRMRVSPDGRWLLAGERSSTEMRLLAAADGRTVRRLQVSYDAHGLFLGGGEDLLAMTSEAVRRERCADGQLRWTVPRTGTGQSAGPVAVAPDGRTVAVAPGGLEVILMDGETGEEWCRLDPPEPGSAVALRFSPDGRYLGVATASHTAVLWDLADVRQGLRELKLDWPAPSMSQAGLARRVTFSRSAPVRAERKITIHPGALNLSGFATHTVVNFSSGSPDNHLTGMMPGRLTVDGVEFELGGLIQLGGGFVPDLPRRVAGIPVHRRCQRLHFLHASTWDGSTHGEIGRYTVVYADGSTEIIPLVHGENIHDWWIDPTHPPTPRPVWTGSNPVARASGRSLGLFHLIWSNPHSELAVESLTFETDGETRLPFLVAVTAE